MICSIVLDPRDLGLWLQAHSSCHIDLVVKKQDDSSTEPQPAFTVSARVVSRFQSHLEKEEVPFKNRSSQESKG